MSQRSPRGTSSTGLICVSIRFWPAVTKLKAPALPLRIGTGFSLSLEGEESEETLDPGVCATDHADMPSKTSKASPGRALPCRRRDAAFLHCSNTDELRLTT